MSNLSDRELARRLHQWINDRPALDATHDELMAHIGYGHGLAEECLERLDPPADDIGMVSLAAALGAVPDVIDLRPLIGPDGSVVE